MRFRGCMAGMLILFVNAVVLFAKQQERYDALHKHFSEKGVDIGGVFTIGVLVLLVVVIMIYHHRQHMKQIKEHHKEIVKHHKEMIKHIKKDSEQ